VRLKRAIPFTKASACGNDFLLVERTHAPAERSLSEWTRRLCDRRDGVGADGVEWISPDPAADAAIELINADGSPAEISGNGTRCAAAYLLSVAHQRPAPSGSDSQAEAGKSDGAPAAGVKIGSSVSICTGAGVRNCVLLAQAGNGFEFETAMGEAEIGGSMVVPWFSETVTGTAVSMGNPHFVMFVDSLPGGWQGEAARIGRLSAFPHGVNVELVQVTGPGVLSAVFFERGAGETQSSGTGSCAAAVAAIAAGKVKSPVEVRSPGGAQVVRWAGEVFLRGPAQLVCRGEFFADW
jgi:diaminopimelate epimerase